MTPFLYPFFLKFRKTVLSYLPLSGGTCHVSAGLAKAGSAQPVTVVRRVLRFWRRLTAVHAVFQTPSPVPCRFQVSQAPFRSEPDFYFFIIQLQLKGVAIRSQVTFFCRQLNVEIQRFAATEHTDFEPDLKANICNATFSKNSAISSNVTAWNMAFYACAVNIAITSA